MCDNQATGGHISSHPRIVSEAIGWLSSQRYYLGAGASALDRFYWQGESPRPWAPVNSGCFGCTFFGGLAMSVRLEALESVPHGRPASGYNPALDGVRAIGVALVFVHHMVTPLPFGGAVGVDVFFVLSGFLITTILLRERVHTGGIRLKRFYLRRLIRLYPALLLAISVIFIPGLILAPAQRVWLIDNVLALTYTTPIARDLGWTFSKAWGHTWTLGIEEMFYLMWPIALLLLFRKFGANRGTTIVAAAIGSLMIACNLAAELGGGRPSELLRAGGLFIGCALAALLWNRSKSGVPRGVGWAGLLLIAAAVAYRTTEGPISIAVLLAVTGSLGLIATLATSHDSALYRMLAIRPMAYLGRISYELYLWHYPIMVVCAWAVGGRLVDAAWISVPLSILAAAGAHHLLASAVDQWKHHVQ